MVLLKKWDTKMSLRGSVVIAAISCLLLLAACGGDSGSSGPSDNGTSESEGNATSSSSTNKTNYSSSVTQSDSEESSSSTFDVQNCSTLLAETAGWSWDVPKECRFNTNITYGTMTDPRDKKVYKTVKIGDQTWMAENLNYADSVKTPSLLINNWCYNDKAENCAVAGRLYSWVAAIDSVKLATDADNPQNCGLEKTCTLPAKVQGICPDGWHLPTKTEWETLFAEVGGESTAGTVLKSQTGWRRNGNGTDDVGFSALPVGDWDLIDNFSDDGDIACFWSATERDDGYDAYFVYLDHDLDVAELDRYIKYVGFSVRCLQD